MADLVMEIIFARDIGGLESINENNYTEKIIILWDGESRRWRSVQGGADHFYFITTPHLISNSHIWVFTAVTL